MKKNLQMPLIKKWFEMTDINGKTEDYREITPYWCSRLCLFRCEKKNQKWWLENYFEIEGMKCDLYEIVDNISIFCSFTKRFEINTMTLGYPKSTDKERIKIFEHAGIEIGYGKHEWGAEPNKLYFIIKHGKRLQ